jgi:hypothetical protein
MDGAVRVIYSQIPMDLLITIKQIFDPLPDLSVLKTRIKKISA